jgi:N6-L-threonylcarbamoyladenine synthase
MITLGIETSCDETSVAIIKDGTLTANLISSQHFHKNYGGVVPELSSRAHIQIITPLIKEALRISSTNLRDIDLISATAGPGLIGALLVGLTFAKGLALSLEKHFIAVNHIEGHIFSGFLMPDKPDFPFLCLVVSGGHTLLLFVKNFNEIYKLGTTVDDAAGEAFDKVSKLLGLGYPGGPEIEKAASSGDENRVDFPVSELKNPFDFSFSGLKTAVLRYVQKLGGVTELDSQHISDIAASFQKALIRALTSKLELALREYDVNSISIVGGVAANSLLKKKATEIATSFNKKIVIPSIEFCGDNAAMIAFRAETLFNLGVKHQLDFKPFPSLSENSFLV